MADPITFPSTTTNFSLPLLFAGQAQKEFFVNQSLTIIDTLLKHVVVDSISTPPASPPEGSCYRVTAPASNEWAGREDDIALRVGGAWQFLPPHRGMTLFDTQSDTLIHYSGAWQHSIEPAQPSGGTTIDSEVRAALGELIETLRKVGVFAPAS